MSLIAHLAVLGVLALDLIFGATLVEHLAGRPAMIGFEFVLILGCVLLVQRWGAPWGAEARTR